MKKKQRCFVKRFAALVAALMLCSSLCVPCFASNNAATKKWVVSDERMLITESGSSGRYLLLSPYVNGEKYAATFRTIGQSVKRLNDNPPYDFWCAPVNYPDWWRSAIPLGAVSYVHFSSVVVKSISDTKGTSPSSISSVYFYPLNSRYSFDATLSYSSSAVAVASPLFSYPIALYYSITSAGTTLYNSGWGIPVSSSGTGSAYYQLQNSKQICYSSAFQITTGTAAAPAFSPGFCSIPTMYNVSSDELIFVVAPEFMGNQVMHTAYSYDMVVSAVVEFWVDANKLPAGLQVGDEFPADTDAFDQLRDDLIDQFPEASGNIENGKSTLTGWNDTETVDTDVASTAMSALNGLFQNLGQFLFIVSLMVFGAVVLRMFIKKAVDG